MPEQAPDDNPLNWVDPDILAYENGDTSKLDHEQELEFKQFFVQEWPKPKWDYLRDRWDPLITDEDPRGRLMAKPALWNLVQYHELQRKIGERA